MSLVSLPRAAVSPVSLPRVPPESGVDTTCRIVVWCRLARLYLPSSSVSVVSVSALRFVRCLVGHVVAVSACVSFVPPLVFWTRHDVLFVSRGRGHLPRGGRGLWLRLLVGVLEGATTHLVTAKAATTGGERATGSYDERNPHAATRSGAAAASSAARPELRHRLPRPAARSRNERSQHDDDAASQGQQPTPPQRPYSQAPATHGRRACLAADRAGFVHQEVRPWIRVTRPHGTPGWVSCHPGTRTPATVLWRCAKRPRTPPRPFS